MHITYTNAYTSLVLCKHFFEIVCLNFRALATQIISLPTQIVSPRAETRQNGQCNETTKVAKQKVSPCALSKSQFFKAHFTNKNFDWETVKTAHTVNF